MDRVDEKHAQIEALLAQQRAAISEQSAIFEKCQAETKGISKKFDQFKEEITEYVSRQV